jgi:hypothetical protein
VEDDPVEEVDDFEADLEAVDVVSFALAVVVSLGSNAVVSGSILAATATVTRRLGVLCIVFFFLPRLEGAYAVSTRFRDIATKQ